jgi:hypothetical protein
MMGELDASYAARDGASAALVAARVAGTVGDVLGGMDEASAVTGRLAGRVETLLWCQSEVQLLLEQWKAQDRFADTRPLEDFLNRVRDSLRAVQDGTGAVDGLVRTVVADLDVGSPEAEAVPEA